MISLQEFIFENVELSNKEKLQIYDSLLSNGLLSKFKKIFNKPEQAILKLCPQTIQDDLGVTVSLQKKWGVNVMIIALKNEPKKYIVLMKDKNSYTIHFENETAKKTMEPAELNALLETVKDIVPIGITFEQTGGCTPGGISALKKLEQHGFKMKIEPANKDLRYWAGENLLNTDKLEAWLAKPEHHKDFEVTKEYKKGDKLTKENTIPKRHTLVRI